jgi:DNA-binding response OmpR family regulator
MPKILVIDDDVVLSKMYISAFNFAGFETASAMNGEEGLLKVKEFKPDIILSDIMMPKIDGLEFLKKIKGKKDTKNIKVFIMTNLRDEENSKQALDNGAEKVIIKNEQGPSELVNIIKSVLQPSG